MTKSIALPKLLKARQLHSRIFAAVMVVVLFVSTPYLSIGNPLRDLMFWAGYALVMVGAMGRVYCSVYIGGRKNDVVVRDGIFAVVRNPLYVCSFLAIAGVGLQSGMVLVLILLCGAFLLYYPLVVAKEEAFLLNKFGEPYERYMQEVPRWMPNFSLWREPEEVTIKPKFIRRTMLDAMIFFLPLPGFFLISQLHTHHLLPVWFILP